MVQRPADSNPVIIDVPETVGEPEVRRALIEQLRGLLGTGPVEIVLNVGALTSADTEQLGAIIQAYITVTKNGGTLKLTKLTKRVRRLLAITRVDRIIETV